MMFSSKIVKETTFHFPRVIRILPLCAFASWLTPFALECGSCNTHDQEHSNHAQLALKEKKNTSELQAKISTCETYTQTSLDQAEVT